MPGGALEFRILGPLEVLRDGAPVHVRGLRQRTLVAALVLHTGRVVPLRGLVDALWGEDPPSSAREQVRNGVSALRRTLGDEAGRIVVTEDAGYRLCESGHRIDVDQFEEFVVAGRGAAAAGDLDRADDLLRSALGLWRGPALAGIPGGMVRDAAAGLAERRLAIVEERLEVELALGRHAEIVGELTDLAARHPERTRMTAQLMRALYQAGRSGDALACYQRAAKRLADELGLDPPRELAELQLAILRGDLEHVTPPAGAARPPRPESRPAQLPADLATFTGRACEVADLLDVFCSGEPATVVIGAVDGMAGIGKTALAVHVAHRVAHRFGDGVLFIDLHGFTPGTPPTPTEHALDCLLRGLGVPGPQIPPELETKVGLYRSVLAGRRVLIVLDNALDEVQVRPLLPGSPSCAVLVTSRRRLADLDDARLVSLDGLPPADAVTLFTQAAGANRLATQPASLLAEAVELCGRLPLAIRIAAARLRSRPAWTLEYLLERLRNHHDRLAELHIGQRSVVAAFQVSYLQLTAEQQRHYRLLGLHPGADFDAPAAGALTGETEQRMRSSLDELLDGHLLMQHTPGRYRFHDLLRIHAATLTEDEPERQQALDRLCAHYAGSAAAAMDLAYPYASHQRPCPPASSLARTFGGRRQAEFWLDTELDNMLATIADDRPVHTMHQSATLQAHLRARGHHVRAERLHHRALQAARTAGSAAGEQSALLGLGWAHRMCGRQEQATDCFERALHLAQSTGNRTGELNALTGLGHASHLRGQHEQAVDRYEQALQVARDMADHHGELDVLVGLGHAHRMCGRHGEAASCFEHAQRIGQATGNRHGELNALVGLGHVHRAQGADERAAHCFEQALPAAQEVGNRTVQQAALLGLGWVHHLLGRHGLAAGRFEQALRIARESGNGVGELDALTGLGQACHQQGSHAQAAEWFEQALTNARTSGSRNGQFEAHHGLGRVHHAMGRHDDALASHRTALDLAVELGQSPDAARAHDGLAHAHLAFGHRDEARCHWRTALEILTSHEVDHTDEPQVTTAMVRKRLAGLPD